MSFSEMFPSSHNNNNNNVYYKPFFNDITTNDHQSSFFTHLPPSPSPNFINPCSYDDLFTNQNGEFLLHQQQQQQPQQQQQELQSQILENINNAMFNFNNNNNTEDLRCPAESTINNNKKEAGVIRKRSSKRDRHSKINTAQGPRDRRMRLSLKVAREFFDLQDKLSFDKASKTVEWLLLQAHSAIMKLSGGTTSANVVVNQSASSTSECEVVSGIEDEAAAVIKDVNVTKGKSTNNKAKKAKTCSSSRKASFHPQANKESRVRARAKARERTRKKIDEQLRELEKANKINNGGIFNQLSCDWRRIEESAATQNNHCISEVFEPQKITSPLATSESITDESWAAIGKWSPFPSLTHLYNSEFPQEQNQITDYQTLCRPIWESL